jgi:hypothetical protein
MMSRTTGIHRSIHAAISDVYNCELVVPAVVEPSLVVDSPLSYSQHQ